MLSDVPPSQLLIPRYLQPGKHDIAAVISSMREVTHRIAAKYPVRYSVGDQAPESYAQLRAATTTQLVVLGPYSNRTIYGDPTVNHVQRAIHDTLHLSLAADTAMLGEWRVAIAQANEASRLMGDTAADWIFSDIFGQTLHMGKYRLFPLDQTGFVHHFVTTGQVVRF